MNKKSLEWVQAAKILGKDPSQIIVCPECNIGHLVVKDEIIEQWQKIDRYLICDNCGKWNVLTMQMPENYSSESDRPK